MEVFSLLKFWRNAGGDAFAGDGCPDVDISHNQALETDDESDDEDSFFDLVFAAPECDGKEENNSSGGVHIINSFDSDKYHHDNLSKRDGETRSNFVESPNDVFHKRKLLPIQPNSKPQSPISLLRSPPKFRVLMLGFNKSKLDKRETNGVSMATPKRHLRKEQSKRFTVQCKVEEVPIASLFARDNSLRSKLQREKSDDAPMDGSSKRFSKDVVHKYLNLIKPLYVRVSKRYSEKTMFSDQHSTVSPFSSPATAPACSPRKHVEEKAGSRTAVFREVCKHLVKSRSASSAVGIGPSPASRRDDSALQQQDGIQSAILHCKRSYSSSSQERSLLSRSASDSSGEKSTTNPPRISMEEEKRSSI